MGVSRCIGMDKRCGFATQIGDVEHIPSVHIPVLQPRQNCLQRLSLVLKNPCGQLGDFSSACNPGELVVDVNSSTAEF